MCESCDLQLGDSLTKISKNDKPWVTHRKNADEVQEIYAFAENGAFSRYADRMSTCGQFLIFKEFTAEERAVMEHDKRLKLAKARFCRVRHCPVCAWRRTLALLARFEKHLPDYLSQYPDYDYLVLTLTVKNPEMSALRATIQKMNDSFKKLLKRDDVLRICKGFIRVVEVTQGNDNLPHPHLHNTIAVNKSYFNHKTYINSRKWVELWRSCLGVDYDPVVHVKKAYCKRLAEQNQSAISAGERIKAAIREVVKYSTKEADLIKDPSFLLGLTEQVQRLRFVSTGGCLKGILSNSAGEDPEDVSSNEMLLKEDCEDPANGRQLVFWWENKDYILSKIKNVNNK